MGSYLPPILEYLAREMVGPGQSHPAVTRDEHGEGADHVDEYGDRQADEDEKFQFHSPPLSGFFSGLGAVGSGSPVLPGHEGDDEGEDDDDHRESDSKHLENLSSIRVVHVPSQERFFQTTLYNIFI